MQTEKISELNDKNYSLTAPNKAYSKHKIFNQLAEYAEFYDLLSFSICGFFTQGTRSHYMSIDSPVYSSIQETLESIKDVLVAGRINDGYALLRKYYDARLVFKAFLTLGTHYFWRILYSNGVLTPAQNCRNNFARTEGATRRVRSMDSRA